MRADVGLDVEVGILGAGDGQGGADQIDILVPDLRTNQGGKGLGQRGLAMVAHEFMLAEMRVEDVPRGSVFHSLLINRFFCFSGRRNSSCKERKQIPRRFAPRDDKRARVGMQERMVEE